MALLIGVPLRGGGKARAARAGTQPRELPVLVDGVETEIDRHFLDHFVLCLSNQLTMQTGEENPFRNILLPMAIRHKGLMHSLLCLSGSHLAQENPEAYSDRRDHHHLVAIHELRTDKKLDDQANRRSTELVDDPTVAQTLTLCLNSICRGEKEGEYRPHLDIGRYHALHHKSKSQAFRQFLFEFFHYHDVVNSLTTLDRRPLMLTEDFQLPEFIVQPGAGALLGVFDRLFGYISKITRIRDTIRVRKRDDIEPLVDYPTLSDAVCLDTEIRGWVSPQPENTHKFIASQLYRQCTWIYLYRTIQPSRPSEKICEAVEEGLAFLRQLPPDTGTQSILLMPLFLLGCAAFVPEQRPDIRRAFGTLKRYSNLGNIEPAREVVEKVWARMDAKDESSWDWESIIQEMGYDFLVT
ncbi:MAG: hypothetical protein M1837_000461 [Sclerophora amabilis]|nr:MAG: hypothetical protein M1837_000461 [Sclerophora amabilis]